MTDSAPSPRIVGNELARAGVTDVFTDDGSRARYSSDASLYRLLPAAVVRPHDEGEVQATLETARRLGVPVVARGAGTSVAGNAVGTGIVLDFSRHMDAILEINPETRTARVQPGVIQARLQDAARPHGLLFGPDPSTMSRCTIGGMIGNNACGSRSLGYGRTSDNVLGLGFLLADGTGLAVGSVGCEPTAADPRLGRLQSLINSNLATVRTELGRFDRQVSGYALEHLLPERGFDVARFLVGTEGTLGVTTEAEVRLVEAPRCTRLVVLGFATIAHAGDATPSILDHAPTACEGLDARIVDVVRQRRGPAAVPELPSGAAWALVELAGDTAAEVETAAAQLIKSVDAVDARMITDTTEAAALWRIRADGAGLSGRSTNNRPAHAGWEDAAVPPQALGRYLRRFDDLLTEHGLSGFPFGHFGEGCLHVRLDFPLDRPGGPGRMRAFLEDAARLVGEFGGSLSGEHGDGRARSELLPLMYSTRALQLFAGVKEIFDPDTLLNPGVLIDPEPLDRNLRVPAASSVRAQLAFAYEEDGGSFTQAVHRCTGVGKCRADNDHGVMCPSYLASRDEKDSTRGRARVLQELVNGSLITDWSSPAVHDSLDLCLSCKGCASDCPTGIDMATFKSEVLHQTYRRRLRPITHYTLGWLPRWSALASLIPGLVNGIMQSKMIAPIALQLGGIDARRRVPVFARQPFRRQRRKLARAGDDVLVRPRVVLFVDTFSEYFSPQVAHAAVRVLDACGYHVEFVPKRRCCGLTWITTGQLDAAKRILRETVADLLPYAEAGIPIVGLEPSCTAVLRKDSVELLQQPEAQMVAEHTFTLAEFLERSEWTAPDLGGLHVVVQPHCHHHAVLGWDTDRRLLQRLNVDLTVLSGCCGLAGNFGVERGHYETSVAVADQHLLPAMQAHPDAVVLADGFSCRTQLADLANRESRHLAEILSDALTHAADTPMPSTAESGDPRGLNRD
ncbi:FAD-binding and (Fe-S)-binding domain-containing protein [Streptomyces chartreusis]|uniref:FAD-binding and (Fe-S)-binding domain-containing protein n=1 Tax=Streptomyces chartreusis TaxID=1969 RepID=UPI003666212A